MADTTKKIIRGIVNSRGFTITSAITQWDYGWQFIPEIEDLPATYRLDFSNEEKHGTALPVYCSTEGAEVPTELIDTGKDVWVWFVRIGDGYGITEYKWRIPNKCKSRVESEEPTPSQQSSIDQAISVVNEAVETAEEKASDASASAQSAQDYAEQAESARDTAQGYASNAQLSATQASNSAGSANQSAQASAQSASQSAQIKADVEDLADDAQASADASAQSASASANSATTAQGYATSASQSATSASGYASQAQTSAQTASSKAQDASTSAQTASTKATEASQSASQASGYAQTAESAKTDAQTAKTQAESARDTAVQAKTDAESARDEAQTLVDGISGKVEQIDSNTERIESLEDDRYKPYVTDSASGSIASFPDGADDIPLKSLVVDINPVQDTSSGDPSPENIYPISGWTQVDVNHSGADMTNPTTITINLGQTVYGGKLDVLAGKLTVTHEKAIVRSFTGAFGKTTNGYAAYIVVEKYTHNVPRNGYRKMKSNMFAYSEYSRTKLSLYSYGGDDGANKTQTFILPNTITSLAEANAWLSALDTPLECTFYLATPIEIQLTPTEVRSLLGTNNIWADSGDCTVEYRADTKLFIERLTAPDSADMIADANITSGQYFMVGNSLYKATANIANGSAIIVGTNCIRKSLSEALNEINA